MTPQEQSEITEYFKRDLPKALSIPGSTIEDCKRFVETQLIRMEHGSQIIRQVSYDHLVSLKQALEKL